MNTPSINTAPLRIDSLDSTVFKSFSALILPSVQELVQTQQELRKIAEENKHKIKIISLNQDCVTSWMQASVELEARKAKLQDEINRKAVMKAEEDEIDELSSESRHDSIPLATDHGSISSSVVDPDETRSSLITNGGNLSLSNGGQIKLESSPARERSTPVGPGKKLSSFPSKSDSKSKIQSMKNARIKKRSSLAGEVSFRSSLTPEAKDAQLEGDYSHAKLPANQIPLATFWSYVDQFYRNLTSEDMNFFSSNGDEITPFMIPPFGAHFTQQWRDDEKRLLTLFQDGALNPAVASNREYAEVDDTIYDGDLHMGSLSERLISAFIREGVVPDQMDEDDDPLPSSSRVVHKLRTKTDLSLFEERLKAELVHIGLLTHQEAEQEENEITTLLLQTQGELREQIAQNSKRKRDLCKIAEEHMAFQEYSVLLDEINKTVEKAYIKRFKSAASKKPGKKPGKLPSSSVGSKGTPNFKLKSFSSSLPTPEVFNNAVTQLMDNRKRFIDQVGAVYFPPGKFSIPKLSIYSPPLVDDVCDSPVQDIQEDA